MARTNEVQEMKNLLQLNLVSVVLILGCGCMQCISAYRTYGAVSTR